MVYKIAYDYQTLSSKVYRVHTPYFQVTSSALIPLVVNLTCDSPQGWHVEIHGMYVRQQ